MRYVISIGSNKCRRENMLLARRRLADYFADIRFSEEEETEPLFFHRQDKFMNQVACFHSDWDKEKLSACLKSIEREAGRRPEDKRNEIVRLDIDVLACDDVIYKPEDMKRDYIRRGLREIMCQCVNMPMC